MNQCKLQLEKIKAKKKSRQREDRFVSLRNLSSVLVQCDGFILKSFLFNPLYAECRKPLIFGCNFLIFFFYIFYFMRDFLIELCQQNNSF